MESTYPSAPSGKRLPGETNGRGTLVDGNIRAIAYDQRDSGASVNPPGPYGIPDLAEDCAALIRGLGCERAHIFGSSLGGFVVAELRSILVHRSPEADARRLAAIPGFDLTERLPEITAPTLLIYGEDDPAASPEIGQKIADAIPAARLEVIPGARHGITVEFARETARLLRDFVLAHPSQPAR